jgi:hypothetical protein
MSEKRTRQLKALAKSLPQNFLTSLEAAMSVGGDANMLLARDVLRDELISRHTKSLVFAPYMPMFEDRLDGIEAVRLPKWLIDNLWRALERNEPELFLEARVVSCSLIPEETTPVVYYRLVSAAIHILKRYPKDILPAHSGDEDKACLETFMAYLELHRLVRQILAKVQDGKGHIDIQKATSLRLLYKDANAITETGGLQLLEVLMANLTEGHLIIKFVAAVSERASDNYIHYTGLNDFGDRLLKVIEADLSQWDMNLKLSYRQPPQTPSCGQALANLMSMVKNFESHVNLSRDGPWAIRIANVRKTIADKAEQILLSAEKHLSAALPVSSSRVRGIPLITASVSQETLDEAIWLFTFIKEMRPTTTTGGYSALYTKVYQTLTTRLELYFDDLMSVVNTDQAYEAKLILGLAERAMCLTEALYGAEGQDKLTLMHRRLLSSNLNKPQSNVA